MPCFDCVNFVGTCPICDGTGWIEPDYEAEAMIADYQDYGFEVEHQEYYEEPDYMEFL